MCIRDRYMGLMMNLTSAIKNVFQLSSPNDTIFMFNNTDLSKVLNGQDIQNTDLAMQVIVPALVMELAVYESKESDAFHSLRKTAIVSSVLLLVWIVCVWIAYYRWVEPTELKMLARAEWMNYLSNNDVHDGENGIIPNPHAARFLV
eukprot:TRINITY_DN5848_c0_g3_i1.p2 TRINITY_DN5848_c0_g3~~TRINITY_DN5848_c0_g3_i1.p2  ORF type:complete len:147 (+),score=31.11 TRINITY_DN5848_c0_g3_i1:64-504(+)